MRERLGVIGLGRMGRAMAARLADQGAAVTGWTRSGLTDADAQAMWIKAADGLEGLVAGSDVLILSLFDDDAVRAVLDQLTAFDLDGKLIIDTSTVSPGLLPAYAGGPFGLVDAPISGGPEMVTAGSCGIFIGGASGDVTRAEAVLRLVSQRIVVTGALGTGMGMKIANNAMLAGFFATISEVAQIGKQAGLDFAQMMQVIAGGPAGPPFIQARMPRVLGEDDSVGFPVRGTIKDVDVFRGAARELGVDTPVLARAAEVMELAEAEGLGDRDLAVMVRAAWDRA